MIVIDALTRINVRKLPTTIPTYHYPLRLRNYNAQHPKHIQNNAKVNLLS